LSQCAFVSTIIQKVAGDFHENLEEGLVTVVTSNRKAQLTLTNPRDLKGCKNCSNSTCFVSFHSIPFTQISNFQCI